MPLCANPNPTPIPTFPLRGKECFDAGDERFPPLQGEGGFDACEEGFPPLQGEGEGGGGVGSECVSITCYGLLITPGRSAASMAWRRVSIAAVRVKLLRQASTILRSGAGRVNGT